MEGGGGGSEGDGGPEHGKGGCWGSMFAARGRERGRGGGQRGNGEGRRAEDGGRGRRRRWGRKRLKEERVYWDHSGVAEQEETNISRKVGRTAGGRNEGHTHTLAVTVLSCEASNKRAEG